MAEGENLFEALDKRVAQALTRVLDNLPDRRTASRGVVAWHAYEGAVARVGRAAEECDILKLQLALKEFGKVEEILKQEGPPILSAVFGLPEHRAFWEGITDVNRAVAERNKASLENMCGCRLKTGSAHT